jgi:hypothetical protein
VECGSSLDRAGDRTVTTTESDQELEYIVVDRCRKCYAWFTDAGQQGNWIGYHDDAEPERMAKQFQTFVKECGK